MQVAELAIKVRSALSTQNGYKAEEAAPEAVRGFLRRNGPLLQRVLQGQLSRMLYADGSCCHVAAKVVAISMAARFQLGIGDHAAAPSVEIREWALAQPGNGVYGHENLKFKPVAGHPMLIDPTAGQFNPGLKNRILVADFDRGVEALGLVDPEVAIDAEIESLEPALRPQARREAQAALDDPSHQMVRGWWSAGADYKSRTSRTAAILSDRVDLLHGELGNLSDEYLRILTGAATEFLRNARSG